MPLETSVDQGEIERFSQSASEWWDPAGTHRALHRLNPVRIGFIREHAVRHFALDAQSMTPLVGRSILDIGCGGGLLCEPMARLGGEVTGIDPAGEGIEVACAHMRESGLDIDYRATTAEELAAQGDAFDIVLAMEVVEHVVDPARFIATAAGLTASGGIMFAATINRTLKSFALAIVGAEYVLGWIARGTHHWEKFVTPAELETALDGAGFEVDAKTGVIFNPLGEGWQRGRDTDVNYMIAATRPADRGRVQARSGSSVTAVP